MSDTDTTLEEIATEIGEIESGDENALNTLAKGMADGMSGLLDLVKASKGAPDNDDENEPEGDKGDVDTDAGTAGEDEPEGDEEPGYDDMELASGDDYIDATEFMVAMQQDVASMRRLAKANSGANADLLEMVKATNKRLDALTGALAGILSPMSKGVVDIHNHLLNTEELAVGDTPNPTLARKRHGVEPGKPGTLTAVQLLKAKQGMILSEEHIRRYKQTGDFSVDAAEDKSLKAEVGKISA